MSTRARGTSGSSILTALTLAACAGLALPAAAQVQWRSGSPAPAFERTGIDQVLAAEASRARRVLVQLDRPITDAGRAELDARGVTLLAPVGDNAFFASVRPAQGARAGQPNTWITGVAPINPEWKMHPDIRAHLGADVAGDAIPAWAVRGEGDAREVAVNIVLHADAPADIVGADLVKRHGGSSQGAMASVNAFVAHVPLANLGALLLEDDVQWVEPVLPQLQEMNAENRSLTQAAVVQASPYSLTGAGVSVLVFDGGSVRTTHVDFSGRASVFDGSALSGHATHCAGTVGGAGIANPAHRGMAPGVTILSAGVNISGASGWLYTNPVDIEVDYATGYGLGADLSTNSIGTNVAQNGFPCTWHGDYNTTDAVIDSIVRGSSAVTNNSPFRVVWAAGNERGNGRCGTSFATMGPPSGAKNHLCIGSVNADSDNISSFSSWGPTDDGRMKPDFSAPGCQSGGDGGVTSCTSSGDTAYASLCGTSMATPTVAGCTSLLLQDFRARFPGANDPRNSTLKVLFAQSAADRGNPGPDYQYGYGSVRVRDAIDLMRTANFQEAQVAQGQDQNYTITVPAGAAALVVTIAWDDVPATPNAIPALVNDLDLEVYAPGTNARAFPWTLDPAAPANNAVRTQRNTRDNLEQVRVDNPAPGVWNVRVKAFNVPQGPQSFSIVSSHVLAGGQPIPTLSLATADLVSLVPPGTPAAVSADVFIQNDTLVPGSVQLRYRTSPGASFISLPMTLDSGTRWTGTLPGFACDADVEYYFVAQGVLSGASTAPAGGASTPLAADIGVIETFLSFDMESDDGWVGGQPGDTATTGAWNRMDPQATGAQPEDDTTPAPGVACWVTDGNAGTSIGTFDVDNGFTTLLSAPMNLTGLADATLSYSRWYSNTGGAAPNADVFTVQISNDNGSTWLPVETVGPAGPQASGGWNTPTFRVGDLVANPGAAVRLRFIADDAASGSIVEAAVDDLVVSALTCENPGGCDPDFNADGNVDQDDIACLAQVVAGDPSCSSNDPDFNGDGNVDQDDVDVLSQVVSGQPCP
ncbi:MAG: S8 family serine peptidase [Planctomycetota bacterium]|nr:S8 family serine peptidase [Planctomycetota bacterium]